MRGPDQGGRGPLPSLPTADPRKAAAWGVGTVLGLRHADQPQGSAEEVGFADWERLLFVERKAD